MKRLWLYSLLFTPMVAFASSKLALKSQIYVNGVVVGSACSVVVDSGVSRSGLIEFGTHDKNKSNRRGTKSHPFTVKLYEKQATEPGCSAFLAGNDFVKFSFGDKSVNQLDERGVITQGAGDNIRIAISSTDTGVVSNRNTITVNNAELTYPNQFAAKGVFGFMATADGLDSAEVGEYYGSLSLVVTYQ
ncbi:fimbrial protein [Photobacterium kishitanii]|uniref:fimbrial protein n=1 Tax=Photobacterium kishitanii TaxID=318456 RepID=UPI0004347ADD|nr:type 1 fimbrial protein [Photobacterium kishitanii]CEO40982.1 CshA minor pilin [Photobacterium kishitanii]